MLTKWLVSEFCAHALFNGWHIYLRDSDRHARNADGSWGWLRRGDHLTILAHAHAALLSIGIHGRRRPARHRRTAVARLDGPHEVA